MPTITKPFVRRTRHLNIYGDESSQNAHHYLVIGTISCEAERLDRIFAKLEIAISKFRKTSELKWQNLGKLELPMYEAYIGALFDTFRSESVRFHSIVVDMTKANDAKFNEGDSEIGFSKYVFTLLNKYTFHHRALDPVFKVYLDERDTTHTLETTRRSLNRRAHSDYGQWRYQIFHTLEYVKSHEHRLVQAADIITGAIAYIWNGHHKQKSPAKHKVAMCDFIGKRLWSDRTALGKPTLPYIEHRGISIWLLDWDADRRKALIATHKDQLLHIPATNSLVELRSHGFEVSLTCPKCWHLRKNVAHPDTVALPFSGPFPCVRSRCDGKAIPTLNPDPLKVPLFSRPLSPSTG
jgi:hypothetical protein